MAQVYPGSRVGGAVVLAVLGPEHQCCQWQFSLCRVRASWGSQSDLGLFLVASPSHLVCTFIKMELLTPTTWNCHEGDMTMQVKAPSTRSRKLQSCQFPSFLFQQSVSFLPLRGGSGLVVSWIQRVRSELTRQDSTRCNSHVSSMATQGGALYPAYKIKRKGQGSGLQEQRIGLQTIWQEKCECGQLAWRALGSLFWYYRSIIIYPESCLQSAMRW